MKQLLGFVMFWIGVGILTTFFMPVQGWFVRALAAFSLMLVGYNLFSSDDARSVTFYFLRKIKYL